MNRAELPGVMPPPVWENVAPTLASFILTAPEFQGGEDFSVEIAVMNYISFFFC